MADESKDLDKLVNKALNDAAFRHKLENDAPGALAELHIKDTDGAKAKAVKKLSWRQLQTLAESFGYDMSSDAN
jgi:hypothetical protein